MFAPGLAVLLTDWRSVQRRPYISSWAAQKPCHSRAQAKMELTSGILSN